MKVLVTGGTGVIGAGVLPALLKAGHKVRLLTRGAERDAREWPEGVEPFAADVSDAGGLGGACDGCGAVVHVTGIVEETPPHVTFERVNVRGTKNVLREAERAGTGRFVFVSSLGADRGASRYHRSKLKAEGLVRGFRGLWMILRPGGVYGPGDEVVSTLLKMVRALPAVPVIDGGDQRFQPVWYEDFGACVARAVDAPEEAYGRAHEVAGRELTTTRDLVARLSRVTGRAPALVPVPALLTSLGLRVAGALSLDKLAADALGLDAPLNEAKLTMLVEENFIREGSANALTDVFRVRPTKLDAGLARLADLVPEQLPSDGFGPLRRKSFRADIEGSKLSAAGLMDVFRERCGEVMPIEFDAEPGTPRRVEKDATLTASLPVRGHIQMRVAESAARRVTFVTVEGHPLAGTVSFTAEPLGRRGAVRFTVELHARAANAIDFLTMSTLGSVLQDRNWERVVGRMVELSGGEAPAGVEREFETLDDEEAERVERWARRLVTSRRRAAREVAGKRGGGAGKAGAKRKTARDAATPKTTRAAAKGKAAAKEKTSAKRKTPAAREATAAGGAVGAGGARGSVAVAIGAVASAALSAVETLSEAAARAAQNAGETGTRPRRRTRR